MNIVVPKDSAAEARIYLRAWLNLHEGDGVQRARRMILMLRIVSLVAGIAVCGGMIFAWHPIAIGVAGVVLGFAGAEAGALMSRLRAWPHNQKFIDWERVREELQEGGTEQE